MNLLSPLINVCEVLNDMLDLWVRVIVFINQY